MKSYCSIIIVTYNSEKHIEKTLTCLRKQTMPADQVIVVDTGSTNHAYLQQHHDIELIVAPPESGFCKGNNIGMQHIATHCDYVFFLNPDAFINADYLEKAIAFMNTHPNCGAVTGPLLGYDIDADKPTGLYDSTGIFKSWYGRWYDRLQGKKCLLNTMKQEPLPAICGAAFFCRKQALDRVLIRHDEVFDSTFYMYKEDIDLSLRLHHDGWSLMFLPELTAYHCRGWNANRSKMARKARLTSARNELRLQKHGFSPICFAYSLLKYASVKLFDV